MIKVITIIGTRPEIIKLSRVIYKLDKYFENILVHTGQNFDYELNKVFFDDLNVRKPDYYLGARGSFGNQISIILKELEKITNLPLSGLTSMSSNIVEPPSKSSFK